MSVISAGTTAGTAVKVTGNTDGTVVIKTNDTGAGGTTAVTFATNQNATFSAAISATGVTNSALTSGRVTYSTTGGQLTDSANLTFSGNLLAVTGTSSASATNTILSIAGSTSSHYVGLKVGSGANLVGRGTNVDTYWTSNTDLYTYTNTGAASYLSLNGAAFSWNVFGSGTGGAALGAATTVISGSSTGITVTGSLTATTLTPTNALGIAYGGTGATTQQAALNAVAGAVTSGQYLRGNGTNVVMSAIQAADVPTLNQNTTGTASNVTGVVAATNGGTGQSSYAVGDLLYASTTTALSKLADVATGNALISGGVGVAPSWGKIGLTTHVSGTLAVGNGGTGNTSGQAASVANSVTFNSGGAGAVSGTTYNGGSAVTVSYNTIGAYAATNPNGYTSNTGTVTSVTVSAGSGLSGGGTVSTSGTITLTNAGVTSVAAGSGISVSGSTGGVTITNTSPNQLTTTSGSPAYYGARAWVNFNGTTGGIRASVNVSSVTRNGTGDYYVNFSTAMPDANSSVVATCKSVASSTQGCVATIWSGGINTTYVHFYTLQQNTSGLVDSDTVCVSTFR